MTIRSLRVRLSLALFPLAFAPTGCASGPDDNAEDLGQSQDAIRDGYTDEHDKAVVGIFDKQIFGMCSGSLLAPNLVLTARHCVADILDEVQGGIDCAQTTFSSPHAPDNFLVTTFTEMTEEPSHYRTVREVVIVPSGDGVCGNDQAILILSDLVPETEAKPLVPRIDVPLSEGEQYYAVGYGATSGSNAGAGLRRRRDSLFIDCVGEACPKRFVTQTEWVGDTGICQGDSGGPSIDLANRVIGVTSRGSAGCDSPVYGYVFSTAQWIKDTALYAAQLGGYDAPPWATGYPTDPAYSAEVGGACNAPEECGANACLNEYCTRPCNESAACPSGFACGDSSGVCEKVVAKSDKATDGDSAGCSVRPDADPTKPIPWFTGVAALGALGALRRRRARLG